MQYVIGEERSRIYLADDQGGQAEVLCEFSTDRIGESRDLIGEVTLQASWIAWIAMDKLYGSRTQFSAEAAGVGGLWAG